MVGVADGKPIAATSVSVQSGKTYEQEFALEMEKAKVSLLVILHQMCGSARPLVSSQDQQLVLYLGDFGLAAIL